MTDEQEDVTDQDVQDALALTRKHIYLGEPYAPAIMSLARMLAEHRRLVCGRVTDEMVEAVWSEYGSCTISRREHVRELLRVALGARQDEEEPA